MGEGSEALLLVVIGSRRQVWVGGALGGLRQGAFFMGELVQGVGVLCPIKDDDVGDE